MLLFLIAAFVLHRPLKPEDVAAWNPLVMGYTVIMLAAALLFLAAGGALILVSLSKKRATMRRRLFRLITFTATSLLCVVILDVVVSLFPALEIWSRKNDLLGPRADYYTTDAELGFKYAPHLNCPLRIDLVRDSDLVLTGQLHNPPPSGEPEDGMEMSWITDRDGFANRSIPETCDIVAVGDSFIVPPLPRKMFWTALMGEKTGMAAYNTGCGGFSFQQELLVLKRYGLPKKPRIILWAYFQGNDVYEAERFDKYQKSSTDWLTFLRKELEPQRPFPYNRPLVHLLFSLAGSLNTPSDKPVGRDGGTYPGPRKAVAGRVEKPIAFNKGYFYSVCLPREHMKKSKGWQIGRYTLLEAAALCADRGARLVVVYMPAKLTVYLDYVLPHFDRERILEFALPVMRDLSDVDADQFVEMLKENWNVQYEVLKEFCDAHDIEIIDTTPALRASLECGEWPYFCYDTHLNITGNRVVAEVVSAYLNSTSPSEPTPGGAP